jgi:hypothetical protein
MGLAAIMALVGTTGLVAIMGSEAIMASEAPVCSSGSGRTGDRIGDPTGLPMTTPRWWSRPLRSMSNRRRRGLPRRHCPLGIIVTTRRATTRMSSSALVAGDRSLRPHQLVIQQTIGVIVGTLPRIILQRLLRALLLLEAAQARLVSHGHPQQRQRPLLLLQGMPLLSERPLSAPCGEEVQGNSLAWSTESKRSRTSKQCVQIFILCRPNRTVPIHEIVSCLICVSGLNCRR